VSATDAVTDAVMVMYSSGLGECVEFYHGVNNQ